MAWKNWRRHFERNRQRPLPALDGELGIPEAWRDVLAGSLGRFMLGETGEGRIVNEIRGADLRGVDDDYRESLRLFVAEEGRHARILGEILKAMGAKAPGHHWTERAFRRARGLMGVRLKLVVLLTAEVIAEGFYGALADGLPEGQIADALKQIVRDEGHHLDFHVDFLQQQVPGRARKTGFVLLWWSVAGLGCVVALFDHREVLRAAGVSLPELGVHLVRLIRKTGARVVNKDHGLVVSDLGGMFEYSRGSRRAQAVSLARRYRYAG